MKKVSVVAIAHPDYPELFLHGRRTDNQKWTIPGGGADDGEQDHEAALRELAEETGVKVSIKDIKKWGEKVVKSPDDGDIKVSLFTCCCPPSLKLTVGQDPDGEFEMFKFLNPLKHGDLHVPMDRNILRDYLDDQ